MKINQLKVGAVLSYFQMFLGIVVGLVYTPIMLRLLGQSEYGLYNTVSSIISMLSLLNLGFGSGYIRYYSMYKNKKDTEAMWKLNGLFLIIFLIIGIISLICGIFLAFNLELVFSDGLLSSEYKTARILMILLSINMAISFPMSVFLNIISANEKFIFLKLISIIKTVFSPLVTLPFLLMGYRSITMVSITLSFSVITDILYLYYVLVHLKNRFIFKNFEKRIFFSLFTFTAFIAINMIVDQINWSIDKFLLGRFKGTEAVAVYSVGYAIFHLYMMFSCSISSVFVPRIHRIINDTNSNLNHQRNVLTDIFTKVGRIQFILLGLIATGFIFFGEVFITKYWAGKEYTESYYVALLLSIPASIDLIQNLGIEIQRAQNKHKFRAIVFIAMALVNLVLSIILCQKYGPVGSAIGTAISLIVANGIIMNIYYHLKCNLDILFFWSKIIRLSLGMIIPVMYGIIVVPLINHEVIWRYLLSIACYILVYCTSMWFVGLNDFEKSLFSKPIVRVVRFICSKK